MTDMWNGVSDGIAGLPPVAAYTLIAVVVAGETAVLAGTVLPTLTLLLTAGALARTGQLDVVAVIAVAASAAVLGDIAGHATGHALGCRLADGALGRRVPATAWAASRRLVDRHGGKALLLGRFLPSVRTLGPHLAGATGLSRSRLLPWSTSGALVWATAEALLGYTAAMSMSGLWGLGAPVVTAAAALCATAAGLAAIHTRRRRGKNPPRVRSSTQACLRAAAA